MSAYIAAGVILGFYLIEVVEMLSSKSYTIPLRANLILAFAGGVGGHLAYTLIH